MGIFDRKKEGGIMDVIRCDETAYLIWKWRPSGEVNSTKKENSIRYGSSLRVKTGEVAVFVYQQPNGQMMDFLVGPYDGTIKTSNFPVLTSIVGAAFGGNSPFQAEIYFINLQGNNQIKFAVPYFDISDPRFPDYPVPVSIHATLTFSLENYEQFIKLNRMVDFDLDAFYAQIRDAVTRKTKSVVANIPYDYGMPVVQLERKTDFISEVIEEKLRSRMEEFGVTMKHIDVNSIDIDKDSEKYLELKSVTGDIAADMAKTQAEISKQNLIDSARLNALDLEERMRIQREEAQRQQRLQTETNYLGAHAMNLQAGVLNTAAEGLGQMNMNLGGGFDGSSFNPAGMMMGMALGGSLGGQMTNMMNQMGQQINTSMNTPPPLPQSQYMVAENGQQFGPYSIQQLAQLVQSGRMSKQTYVWKQGMNNWELAGNVAELTPLFTSTATPPIPGGMPTPPTPPTI